MTLQELAAQREAAWLAIHGVHEYHLHDLVAETRQELADGTNYTKAEQQTVHDDSYYFLSDALYYIQMAWDRLDAYEARKAVLAKRVSAQGEVAGG